MLAVAGLTKQFGGFIALNDVTLFRDLLAAGANDYLVKPPTRERPAAQWVAGESGDRNLDRGDRQVDAIDRHAGT